MPVPDCEVRDPRIRRTRQLLQDALRTLMQTKSFDEICVHDITEAATVNRATFYDHYNDKYDLLQAMVVGGFHELLKERNICGDKICPSAIGSLILAACHYVSTTCAPTECPRRNGFEPLMEAAITQAIGRVLLNGMPAASPVSGLPLRMIATAASWAIYGAVKEWFNTPNHPPAEEIVPGILHLVLPMLPATSSTPMPPSR